MADAYTKMAKPSLLRLAAVAVLSRLPFANADLASIKPEDDLASWQQQASLTMSMSHDRIEQPYDYVVVPLTTSLGLNQSSTARGSINFTGNLVHVGPNNFDEERTNDVKEEIAYLSCDDPEDPANPDLTADDIVNKVMEQKPKAIVLYSLSKSSCSLGGDDLPYTSLLTLTVPGDGAKALEVLNNTNEADSVQATITGNTTDPLDNSTTRQRGNDSAIAMSVLYSITGLITLLFLIIIATGAFRAHRYPDRYGPRRGDDHRPRQSRAKGIARAVLDTLPIIKFGEPSPATKPDPQHDPDATSLTDQRDPEAGIRPGAGTTTENSVPARGSEVPPAGNSSSAPEPSENLDCSICTDRFVVGQDVRVLPCDHKFHPECIDPWLVEVSGTCPLCRLDLRPQNAQVKVGSQEHLPPPLEMDHETFSASAANSTTTRRTRLLDLGRLRHASVDERIQVLRQLRSEHPRDAESTSGSSRDGHRRAKMADRLREKFRIKTRQQPPNSTETSSTSR